MMYSFAEKKHSGNGFISTIMGAVSCILLLVIVYISYYERGNAGLYAGAFGITGLLFALVGFEIGLYSLTEKNIRYKYPKIGSIFCGIMFILWLGIFLLGF